MSSSGTAELDRNSHGWSKGSRGIPPPPRSGAGVLLGTLTLNVLSLGLPVEGIGILIAIDLIVDMFITATNVTANVTATALLTRADRRK